MNADFLLPVFKYEPFELCLRAKVQKQSNFMIRSPKIMQKLSIMFPVEYGYSLKLEKNTPIHDQIRTKTTHKLPAKIDRNCNLSSHVQPGLHKCNRKSSLIHTLKKAPTKLVINLKIGGQNPRRQSSM